MSTRNCRRTSVEREQHERAIRIRKMTDAQLCEYMDGLEAGSRPVGPSEPEVIGSFLDSLAIRTASGLRVSDATIRKIREIAVEKGLLPDEGGES